MTITVEQLLRDRKLLRKLDTTPQHCPYCGTPIQETITGKRPTPKGPACSDCYYEELGKLVEQSPITSGRVRRG